MTLKALLPSLNNLPVFYATLALVLALVSVSSWALLSRRRTAGTGSGVALRVRLAVLLPAWALWAVWAGYGTYWLGTAALVAGSRLVLLLALATAIGFALFSVFLLYWLRGRAWADAAMLLSLATATLVVSLKYTIWLCEPLGHSRLAVAQLCAGRLYAEGRGGALVDAATAADWYRRAAESGSAEAQFLLGTTVPVRQQREYWLRQATAQGNGPAAFELYMLLGQRPDDLQWLQFAADQNHPDAQYQLARRLVSGDAMARDLPRARALMQMAASAGSVGAMRELALAYADDSVLFEQSDPLSRQWESRALAASERGTRATADEQRFAATFASELQRIRARYAAATSGDSAAQQAIARDILQRAGSDPVLLRRAYAWLERSASSGGADVQLAVAQYYLSLPNPNAEQQQRARQWLVAAADGGQPEALRLLIAAHKKGAYGLDRDLAKAKAYGERLFAVLKAAGVLENQGPWLTAAWDYADTLQLLKREREQYLPPAALAPAARAGDPQAQYHLALELMQREFDAGIALLHSAADGGFAEAQYHAGRRMRARKSTPEDLRRAVRWLTSAVAQGHRGAMHELGMVYLQGIDDIGLARDPARARALFEQALAGGGEVLYRYTDTNGRGWIITAQQVQRTLERIPR